MLRISGSFKNLLHTLHADEYHEGDFNAFSSGVIATALKAKVLVICHSHRPFKDIRLTKKGEAWARANEEG